MGAVMVIVFIWLSLNALFMTLIALAYWHHCRKDCTSPRPPYDKPEQQPPYHHAYRDHTQPHHATPHHPQPSDTDTLLQTSLHPAPLLKSLPATSIHLSRHAPAGTANAPHHAQTKASPPQPREAAR